MKYDLQLKIFGMVFRKVTKGAFSDREIRQKTEKTYRSILENAAPVDPAGPLLGSYAMAAWFLAMNRQDGLSPEENCRILENGLRNSRLYRAFMGNADSYFSEKKMEFRRKWSARTHRPAYQDQFPNDWVVDVLEKTRDYQFGFDYTQCGVCKLCRDEGCPELAKYLCRLDYMTTEMMGVGLRRTGTLAEGASKCDFRFYKQM